MHRTFLKSLAAMALVAVAGAAWAGKLYKWTDAEGNVHYSDKLPPEEAKNAREELNPQGLTIKTVERAKTEEELEAAKAAAALAAEEKRKAEEQAATDQALLNAYPTEADLAASLDNQIEVFIQTIETSRASVASQEKSLTEMLSSAAELEGSGRPVDPALKKAIDDLRLRVEDQKSYMARKQAEMDAARVRFDEEIKHYRALFEKRSLNN